MFTIIFTRPPFLSERVWVLDLAHTGYYYTYILLVPMLTSDGWGGKVSSTLGPQWPLT